MNHMSVGRLAQADLLWCCLTVILGALSAVGQVTMRYGGRGASIRSLLSVHALTEHRTWLCGLVFCWLCGLAWAVIITRINLTIALPLFFGVFYIIAGVGGFVLMGDSIQLKDTLGCVLIFVGIVAILWR